MKEFFEKLTTDEKILELTLFISLTKIIVEEDLNKEQILELLFEASKKLANSI